MTNAQPEPSMEEILASIRRIISEDEEEGAVAEEATASAPAPVIQEVEASQAPEPVEATIVDVEEEAGEPLEEISDDPAPAAVEDSAGVHLETEDVEMIKNNVAEAIQGDEAMLGENSAAAATAAFQNLSQSVRVSDGQGKTLEDIVTELLQPMVKEWLDANLPAIVEEKVEDEVQRVARRRS